ncbi:hypothetical protein CU669_06975 [Paramagnetospirillum kuznetsovii]|uniref:Uncharacterized protein n=1 Tax=Paramagnetospirillum kuznetsovii TaxID=2053833 RepID=A0A364NZD4_9PROT|nr:hypothetical protein [Paramagnetospirillum kuznetsovii]RAU22442.1 hypothetical protein CU669_06975 [Paramagnetospirillum kuznetsovii]
MDPSLIEIIKQAVVNARRQGLAGGQQQDAAVSVLLNMMPSLSPSIAGLIVEQLYPFVEDMGAVA